MFFIFLGYVTKNSSFYASLHAGPVSQNQVLRTDDLHNKRLTSSSVVEWK